MSEQIRLMFADISERYDVGNDILSFGTHRLWKRKLVRAAAPARGARVLDLATGTGDIAFLFADAVGPDGYVLGLDFCADMIDHARARLGAGAGMPRFDVGDAMNLSLPDDTFDVCSISFGIRNVDDPVRALAEMRRVVRPGGRVVVMEFGQPRGPFGAVYRLYSNTILPTVGGLVLGSRSAYDYLNRSAAAFPCREDFLELMRRAGLQRASYRPLFGGIAFIYTAEVE